MANDSTQLVFDAFRFLWHSMKHTNRHRDFADRPHQGPASFGALVLMGDLQFRLRNLSQLNIIPYNSGFQQLPLPFDYFSDKLAGVGVRGIFKFMLRIIANSAFN